jgi:hypothetical protein
LAAGLALVVACEFSETHVDESTVDRVIITDQEGRGWDITQAVVRYGFEPAGFTFGIGASKLIPFQSPAMAAPSDSGYPAPDDSFSVIGLSGAPARAYRVDDLLDVEVADDAIGGVPVAIMVRPLLPGNAPAVVMRMLGADTLTLSATGWVYGSESVLYDLETGSMWYHLGTDARLTCIAGVHFTRNLEGRSFVIAPWAEWLAGHPASLFMLRPPPGPPISIGD